MDPKILKKTQDTLGKIIKRPPLTEKLLSKPPFRFLHDVTMEVVRTSGFGKGLYDGSESDSKSVTAKEDKIKFLQKLIDCVTFASGETVTARPSKIIAGHEPEKTNEMLQLIAKCIRKNISSDKAVEKILKGETSGSSKPREKSSSGKRQKHSAEAKGNEDDKTSRREGSAGEKQTTSEKKSKEVLAPEQELPEERKKHKQRKRKEITEEHNESPSNLAVDESEKLSKQNEPNNGLEEAADHQSAVSRAPRPASAKGQRRKPSGSSRSTRIPENADSPDEPQQVIPKKLARPPSARPAAPRVQRKNMAENESARVDSGGKHRTAPVIVDHGSSLSDEDETFVVEEEQQQFDSYPALEVNSHELDPKDEEHGGLVRKILETKKELEHSAYGKTNSRSHTEIQSSNVTSAQQRKEYELVVKEIEKLRVSVQTVCQSATPLAKIIDYIQEDMDAMQTELQLWSKESKEYKMKIQEEEAVSQRSVKTLQAELDEVEEGILSYRNQVATTKANILRNNEKIQKMVMAVAARS